MLTLQLDGGADVTSFCDPKSNVSGQPEINRWARTQEIRTAGNLRYAPFGKNAAFFDKYFRHMLVINGIDSQTNSHTVGVVNNWSGRNAEGYPSLTALFAAVQQPQLALAYLNFGGFGATQGIIRSTRVSEIAALQNLVLPNQPAQSSDASRRYLPTEDVQRITALHSTRQQREINSSGNAVASDRFNRQLYLDSLLKTDEIAAFAPFIPTADKLQTSRQLSATNTSTLFQQTQLALLAFKAGLSVSADLFLGQFDTHANHEALHAALLGHATDAIDYLWTYAEELGIADRIVLLLSTDFGRTPYFNASDGKDHWPIGSALVMEKNARYGNRMAGITDGGHNAIKINPTTLREDRTAGIILKPAHVHKALRRYLGLEDAPLTKLFGFTTTETVNFFG